MLLAMSSQEVAAAAGVLVALGVVVGLFLTLRSVKLTGSSVELTRQSVEALDMPFVIAKPHSRGWWMSWEEGPQDVHRLRGRLWNMGRGPAIVGDMRLAIDREDIMAPAGGEIPIGAGEQPRHSPQLLRPPPFEGRGELRIYYTHVSGREYMTRSDVIASPDGLLGKNFTREKSDGQGRSLTH